MQGNNKHIFRLEDYDHRPLHQHHKEQLIASAISPEIAKERGYITIHAPVRYMLGELGFAKLQSSMPVLLIPYFDWGFARHRLVRVEPSQ